MRLPLSWSPRVGDGEAEREATWDSLGDTASPDTGRGVVWRGAGTHGGAPWDWRETQKQHLALCWPWVHLFFSPNVLVEWGFFPVIFKSFPRPLESTALDWPVCSVQTHATEAGLTALALWRGIFKSSAGLQLQKKWEEKKNIYISKVMYWNWLYASQGWKPQKWNRKSLSEWPGRALQTQCNTHIVSTDTVIPLSTFLLERHGKEWQYVP